MVLFPGGVFRDAARRQHERKPATISCYMGRLSSGYQSDGTIHGSEGAASPVHGGRFLGAARKQLTPIWQLLSSASSSTTSIRTSSQKAGILQVRPWLIPSFHQGPV